MSTAFTSVWDAIEDTPQEAASMKARSAERMRQSADGTQNSPDAKWNRENFAVALAQDNQTAPLGTSVIEQSRDDSRH